MQQASFWTSLLNGPTGQFLRVIAAAVVTAALSAAGANLGLFHLHPGIQVVIVAALHSLDEYLLARLRRAP